MKESYDKRLNILIHGVKEDSVSSWEKHQTTVTKFQDFSKNELKTNDPDEIEFVDIHRLPRHPTTGDPLCFYRQACDFRLCTSWVLFKQDTRPCYICP